MSVRRRGVRKTRPLTGDTPRASGSVLTSKIKECPATDPDSVSRAWPRVDTDGCNRRRASRFLLARERWQGLLREVFGRRARDPSRPDPGGHYGIGHVWAV